MICIDFQGGAHGNYLEFVCNKIAGITIGTPFNKLGASHKKTYTAPKIFVANHYSFLPVPLCSKRVISIQFDIDDLLSLQQISLLRAGDYGYNNDILEIDTYHKLNNENYSWVLNILYDSFFSNQVKQSYDAVKDPTWPDINTRAEFAQLPQWIQDECKDVHNLILFELNEKSPDCPRQILREFFQIGFDSPTQSGFYVRQTEIKYPENVDVFIFPFSAFYNTEIFMSNISKIASWAGLSYTCQQEIAGLHDEFLQRQPYKNSKSKCDQVIANIKLGLVDNLPSTDLLEEAYINSKLGYDWFK